MEYTLIHWAKKNLWDFLIFERAKKLLESELKTIDFLEVKWWENINDKLLEKINNTKAIIICGWPGLQKNIYPWIYPLRNNLDDITIPMYTLWSWWKWVPWDDTTLYNYKFTKKSKEFLNKIKYFWVRDYKTKIALRENGYTNVSMNWCPVWYDLKSIWKQFKLPKNKSEIKKIVFTPAQNPLFHKQSINCIYIVKDMFPKAKIVLSFHRWIKVDKETPLKESKNIEKIINITKKLNLEVRDTSYSTDKIKFYDDCDLHIWYRVHAHIYFLSKRLPSILIHEDGRWLWVSEAIWIEWINWWKRNFLSETIEKINNPYMTWIYNRIFWIIKDNKNCTKELKNTLLNCIDNWFNKYNWTKEVIDSNFLIMSKFINITIWWWK